jgi:hypothetical protein
MQELRRAWCAVALRVDDQLSRISYECQFLSTSFLTSRSESTIAYILSSTEATTHAHDLQRNKTSFLIRVPPVQPPTKTWILGLSETLKIYNGRLQRACERP